MSQGGNSGFSGKSNRRQQRCKNDRYCQSNHGVVCFVAELLFGDVVGLLVLVAETGRACEL
jgi:hypothetical protein